MRIPLAIVVAFATAAGLAAATPATASPHDVTITVMESSDLHGNALNWDYFKNAE